MRRSLTISLALIVLWVASANAQISPELARVSGAGALVRSGPGEAFYPTGRLEAGERVEIYRRKQNGWCAIRPPQGSFSYVRADHVSPAETDGLLEVTQSGSKTRVGSTLKPAHQVEYVSLKLGERLKSLGGPIRLGNSRHAWYRVAPPSGEFRWVKADDLQLQESVSARTPATTKANAKRNVPQAAAANSFESPRSGRAERSSAARRQLVESGEPNRTSDGPATASGGLAFEKLSATRRQMATEPIPQNILGGDPSIAEASHSEPADPPTAWQENEAGPPAATPAPSVQALPVGSDPGIRLSELELALSRIVTQEPNRWDLVPLRQQVVQLQGYLPDEFTRRAAEQLLERIDEFARLQQRHRTLEAAGLEPRRQPVSLTAALAARPSAGSVTPGLVSLPPEPPNHFLAREAAIRRQAENVHYAGQGWLVPVLSSHTHLPPFALTDRTGSIQAFVSPRPGLNLRRYLRQEVGIVGRETVPIDNDAPHLIADRVVVLDRHR